MMSECTKNRVVPTLVVIAGLGATSLFIGCMTLEQMAPPVEGGLRMMAARRQVEAATLELGREVYLSDCALCHGVEPIARYSADDWNRIMPKMSKKAMLNVRRSEAVTAYVTLAHALLSETPQTGRDHTASSARMVEEDARVTLSAGARR